MKSVMNRDRDSEGKAQVVYFSHGGGPLPILGDPRHKAMIAVKVAIASSLNGSFLEISFFA